MNPNEKYPERITRNTAPDGEFICIMGVQEKVPGIDLMEPEGGLSMLMAAADGRAPKTAHPAKPPTKWEAFKDGFFFALYVAWILVQIIGAVIAVVVAASIIGFGIWFIYNFSGT